MNVRMAAAALACLLAGTVRAAWNPGEPVTTYWFGPGCPGQEQGLTDAWAKQLKEGGFNTVWASRPEELDIAARHGLRAIYSIDPTTEWAKVDLDDPAQKAALAERISRVKGHPALYVYEHYDEAPAGMFAELARVKEFVHGLDPNHAAWFNLLPTYANNRQLGVEGEIIRAYWEHVRLFGETYRPELITYDHYQFCNNGDKGNYFLNLGIIRQSASARRVPFWNGLQACTWVPSGRASPASPRIPGVDELRYLVHTTAAYGAHGLYYYVYCRKGHEGTIATLDGRTGEKYEALKTINRDFVAIASVLAPLDFKGAYFQGCHAPGTTPYCAQALLKLAPETPPTELEPLQEMTDTTLVTRFDAPGRPTHLMVVNCDYRKDRTLRVDTPSVVERFDPAARTWSSAGRTFILELVRGGGVLLRLDVHR